jgi:hypothetical protein
MLLAVSPPYPVSNTFLHLQPSGGGRGGGIRVAPGIGARPVSVGGIAAARQPHHSALSLLMLLLHTHLGAAQGRPSGLRSLVATAHARRASGASVRVFRYSPPCHPPGRVCSTVWPPLTGQAAAINWALAKEGVTPSGSAHRNVPVAKLPKAKASGKEGKLFLAANGRPAGFGPDLPGWNDMSGPQYEQLYKEVTDYLSAAKEVYIEDAAVGSFSAMALPTRAITDDPAIAAFVKGALCPIPTNVDTFAAAMTVYAVPSYTPTGTEGPLAAVNIERGEVILAGGAGGSTLGLAVAPVAEHFNAQQGVVPLSGECSVVGGKTVIVCTPGTGAPKGVPGTAYGRPVVWGEEGIWSVFKTEGPNVLKAPSGIVLVDEGNKAIPAVATLSPQQAAVYLLGLKISGTAEGAESLTQLAASTGTPVVVCNSMAAAVKWIKDGAGGSLGTIDDGIASFVNGAFGGVLSEEIASLCRPPPPAGEE